MQNAKKLYKYLTIFFIILFMLAFSFNFVGCGKKKNDSDTIHNNSIPQTNVFQELKKFVESNYTEADSKNFRYYFLDFQTSIQTKETYAISYHPDYKNYLFFTLNYNDIFATRVAIEEQQDYSQSQKSLLALYNTSDKNYQAALTFPAVQYVGTQTTLSLPEFAKIIPENISEEIKKSFHSQVAAALNKLLSKINNFYIEKIKGGDQRYNEYLYKYFYLPVKFTS